MKGVLYGDYFGEKNIVPILEPLIFVSKESVERMERGKRGDGEMSKVPDRPNNYDDWEQDDLEM